MIRMRKTVHIPKSGQTKSGYGVSMPTEYMVRLPGSAREYRLRVTNLSNVGSYFVTSKGRTRWVMWSELPAVWPRG